MYKKIIAGTFALSLTPVAAMAGGYVEPAADVVAPIAAPPVAVGTDWTGLYGGVQIEYGDAQIDDDAGNAFDDGNGALYGVFGGYRYDFGSFVLGAELDLNAADIDLDGSFNGSIDTVHRLGLEAGFDAGPALVYGTVGAAQATATSNGAEFSDTGVFYGVGVDYLLTDRVTVGAEVLQHQFDDFDGTALDVDVTTFGINAALRF